VRVRRRGARTCPGGRVAALAGLVALLELAVGGCVTVHGETALLPAVAGRQEAAGVLAHFTAVSNRANRTADAELNTTNETGVLGAIDAAQLKVERATRPGGDPGYQPLRLSGTRYLIPEERGWPKWFVADTANNRDSKRWLIAFTRDGAGEPWKAAYLTILDPARMPRFALDAHGHAEAVPLGATGLAVPPGKLGARYARYLGDGRPADFAPGPYTSVLRRQRRALRHTERYVTQYVDQAVPAAQYPAFALRTADGGALVLFTTRHSWKITAAQGTPLPPLNAYTRALITGRAKEWVTQVGLAEEVALVPRGGRVRILDQITGVVSAQGG
jgi:hypothetical protein